MLRRLLLTGLLIFFVNGCSLFGFGNPRVIATVEGEPTYQNGQIEITFKVENDTGERLASYLICYSVIFNNSEPFRHCEEWEDTLEKDEVKTVTETQDIGRIDTVKEVQVTSTDYGVAME